MSCPQQVLNKNIAKETLEPIKDSLEWSPGLWLGSEGAGALRARGSMEDRKPGPDAKVASSHPVPGIHQLEAGVPDMERDTSQSLGYPGHLRTQVMSSHGFLPAISSQ